ncbi:phytanoyl-CoA dioxygenase, peroxisomal [Tetranychus urticae]|uniref:phytanoyl-CoA dioxygenase n=1 Tax=Tetranychus urticae TaxID=32264 RepID=T1KPI6_TETUR|nr:phytanoyl-CoA dioxygenase, peroxisomal [Tetranychus urticae]
MLISSIIPSKILRITSCMPLSYLNRLLTTGSDQTQQSQNDSPVSVKKFSIDQIKFYQENGFFLVKGLIPTDNISSYVQRFNDIANGVVTVPGLVRQKDISLKNEKPSERSVYKLQELFMDDKLFEYCQYSTILDYVQDIIGPNIMAIHTMLINKPPDTGELTSRHPLHQDLHYFPIRPADKIVCAWTALDRSFRDNGCLVVLPKSHKGPLLEHDYPDWQAVNAMYHGVKMKPPEDRFYVEMDPGDTLFFHPLLIHGSGANRTTGFRKAISCHYASSDCHYINIKGTSQENISKEIIEVAKKKFGIDVDDVSVIWKYRAQLVRGDKINL